MTYFDDVRAFHVAAGQPARDMLTKVTAKEREFRLALIDDEFDELIEAACAVRCREDIAEVAAELADIVYVVLGTALFYGIPFDEVWAEIHAANMRKVDGGVMTRPDGKVVKPPDWEPADILAVIG